MKKVLVSWFIAVFVAMKLVGGEVIPPILSVESVGNGVNIKFSTELTKEYYIEYSTTPYNFEYDFGVVSQNTIGYVRLKLNVGFNLICNQFSKSDNKVGTVLTNVPNGTVVYKFDGKVYSCNSYIDGIWELPDMILEVGDGFFIYVPIETTITLVGSVVQKNNKMLSDGINLMSVPLALNGDLFGVGGLTAIDGDTVYQWTGTGFKISEFVDGVWYPSVPVVKAGEGFFLVGKERPYLLDNSSNGDNNWKTSFYGLSTSNKINNLTVPIQKYVGLSTIMDQNVGFFRIILF